MKIKRDGKVYSVVKQTKKSYCVAVEFHFYPNVYKTLYLWWDKKYCKEI